MKNIANRTIILCLGLLFSLSCSDLDLEQQDAASSTNFYQTREQFRQALNEGYRPDFWIADQSLNGIDDDFIRRNALDEIKAGTVSSESSRAINDWSAMYKGITRMVVALERIELQEGVLNEVDARVFRAETYCILGAYWSWMINHYGDVPFYESELELEEAFELGRTPKDEILQKIYQYLDIAIQDLPEVRDERDYMTKGTAYAFKARAALLQNDYATAAQAARACIDLGLYSLHPDFADLFKSSTNNSPEIIFQLPNDVDLDQFNSGFPVQDFIQRNFGGFCARNPSWKLLAAFECTDGLPVDESPLFDPQNPFKNRDPRCNATIAPFGSVSDGDGLEPDDGIDFNGIEYTPHPFRKQVTDFRTGSLIRNNDTRAVANFASFNGLAWKKGIDEDWVDDQREDSNRIWMRYAEVLLIYAEAKIELNEIDQSVLDAINEVRQRAYAGTELTVPLATATDQQELRLKVRNERRMEFANEGIRHMDLIRWRLAEKVFSGGILGQLEVSTDVSPDVAPTGPLVDNLVTPGLYFWGQTPEIDEDGLPDFSGLLANDYCRILVATSFPERQYLRPIPASERLLNPNLTQNPGY